MKASLKLGLYLTSKRTIVRGFVGLLYGWLIRIITIVLLFRDKKRNGHANILMRVDQSRAYHG